MNNRGVSLLNLLLTLFAGTLLFTTLIILMNLLLKQSRDEYRSFQGSSYAVSPSDSEAVRATRFHNALIRIREKSDMVFVFGGRSYLPQGSGWIGFNRPPIQMDMDWHSLQTRIDQENEQNWLYRLSGIGDSLWFFEKPHPLISHEDYELNSENKGFTLLFFRGRSLLAWSQVRVWNEVESEETERLYWESHLYETARNHRFVYRCTWRYDEVPEGEEADPFLEPGRGRFVGVREFRVSLGKAGSGLATFTEVIFPDPLWQGTGADPHREGMPRFAYQFFIR